MGRCDFIASLLMIANKKKGMFVLSGRFTIRGQTGGTKVDEKAAHVEVQQLPENETGHSDNPQPQPNIEQVAIPDGLPPPGQGSSDSLQSPVHVPTDTISDAQPPPKIVAARP